MGIPWRALAAVLVVILACLLAAAVRLTAGGPRVTGGGQPRGRAGTFARLGGWLRSGDGRDVAGAEDVLERMGRFLARRLQPGTRRLQPGTRRGKTGRAMPCAADAAVRAAREGALRGSCDGKILARVSATCAPFRRAAASSFAAAGAAKVDPGAARARAAARVRDVAPAVISALGGRPVVANSAGRIDMQYLDVGCAEGGLTTAFGAAFGLAPEAIHGTDVQDPGGPKNFTFTVGSAEALPYADGTFQVVSLIMALHHFDDPVAALAEARRVLSPGGVLVVREHDCRDEYFAAFLDIVHDLYATALGDEIALRPGRECGDFEAGREMLAATYRTREAWAGLIGAAGFTAVPAGDTPGAPARPDMFNGYYDIFRRG